MYNPLFEGDVCSHNHSFFLDNFIRMIFQNPKKIVGPYIHPGDTIIDLGCGPGYFSIDMAEMTGPEGTVYAVDLQKEMLSKVAHKSVMKKLTDIVHLHRCAQTHIGLPAGINADFILAYYMVHETLDHGDFLTQVKALLASGGKVLIVEPPFHVSGPLFEKITWAALDSGFTIQDRPKGKGGKSLLLTT